MYVLLLPLYYPLSLILFVDKSLEEFLDGEGLDDPLAEHRRSPEAFIEWGRGRTLKVMSQDSTPMTFDGREEVLSALLDYVSTSILKDSDKSSIFFIHASPGVGKTRLFTEVVKMSTDEQKRFLVDNPSIVENATVIDNILHMAITFNSATPYEAKHGKVGPYENRLYQGLTTHTVHVAHNRSSYWKRFYPGSL